TWELPAASIAFCLERAGLDASDLDAIAYSYDPSLAGAVPSATGDLPVDEWEGLRTLFAARANRFLDTLLPTRRASDVHHVPHHIAHAASAFGAAPFGSCAVMVLDGRGERGSYLAGTWDGSRFTTLARQDLPHSLGLRYEELTEHLGFHRSSDE